MPGWFGDEALGGTKKGTRQLSRLGGSKKFKQTYLEVAIPIGKGCGEMENRNTRRKTRTIATFPTTNLTWTDLGMNPDLHEFGSRRLTT